MTERKSLSESLREIIDIVIESYPVGFRQPMDRKTWQIVQGFVAAYERQPGSNEKPPGSLTESELQIAIRELDTIHALVRGFQQELVDVAFKLPSNLTPEKWAKTDDFKQRPERFRYWSTTVYSILDIILYRRILLASEQLGRLNSRVETLTRGIDAEGPTKEVRSFLATAKSSIEKMSQDMARPLSDLDGRITRLAHELSAEQQARERAMSTVLTTLAESGNGDFANAAKSAIAEMNQNAINELSRFDSRIQSIEAQWSAAESERVSQSEPNASLVQQVGELTRSLEAERETRERASSVVERLQRELADERAERQNVASELEMMRESFEALREFVTDAFSEDDQYSEGENDDERADSDDGMSFFSKWLFRNKQ